MTKKANLLFQKQMHSFHQQLINENQEKMLIDIVLRNSNRFPMFVNENTLRKIFCL